MIDTLDIGYAIKDRRAELGLTQAQLAQAAGVSKRCLWSLELGQNPGVQFDKLTAVLSALGLGLSITESDSSASLPDRFQEGRWADPGIQAAAESGIDALAILTEGAARRPES